MLSNLLTLCLSLSPQGETGEEVHVRALVQGPPGVTAELQRLGFDAVTVAARPGDETGHEIAEIVELESAVERLREWRPDYPLLTVERARPFRQVLQQRLAALGPDAPPDPNYRTPAEIEAALLGFEQTYPALARRYDLNARYGASLTHNGNRIYGLRISDNPTVDEDESAVLVMSNHHARELNSIELPLHVADQLLQGYGVDPQITQLIDGNAIWIVPTMNPDGLDHVWNVDQWWRKNRRNNGGGDWGVDLNRNYPYFWSQCGSSSNPGSSTYHGPGPASEPETQLMMALGNAERFERVWDQHSYGRDVRWPHNPLTAPNIPAAVANVIEPFRAQIANVMNYGLNASCCCGGHQHWHFAEYGALAYLSEMGTEFQPPWSSTQNELIRMWPGLREFLIRPVPLTGHVTSLAGGAPLDATIRLPAAPFVDGQQRKSEVRFGRYAVWLEQGTYDLEFTAPGHDSATVRVSLSAGQTTVRDVVLIPSLTPTLLRAAGALRPGQPTDLHLSSPGDPGQGFLMLASTNDTPPIRVGPRTVPVADDFLLASVLSAPQVFVNFIGNLDGGGFATGTAVVPNIPALTGFDVYFAAVTFEAGWPMQVKGISNGLRLAIQ